MWVIEGPFDGTESGTLPVTKLKLLKPGRSYPIGRKAKHPLQIIINHPKISHEHVTFLVGDHTIDDISNPSKVPSLKIYNHRPKMVQFERNKTRMIVNPSTEVELQHDDYIALVSGVYVRVSWRPLCCLVPTKSPSISYHKCAAIGMKVVATLVPEVTHHLVTMLSATPTIVSSTLISAQLVKPDWLTELLRLSEETYEIPQSQAVEVDPAQARSVLEYEYALPSETKYRPPFSPSLPSALKTLKTWEPNPERRDLFSGKRFVFIRKEVDSEMRTLVERGGGEYEAFDVAGGPTRLRQTLERNKRKARKGITVIGDAEKLKIAAADTWSALEAVLIESGLRMIESSVLLDAVLYVDASRLDSNLDIENQPSSSSLPNAPVQENMTDSNADEVGYNPRQSLRRRLSPASRATSIPPEPDLPISIPVPAPAPAPVLVDPTNHAKKPLVLDPNEQDSRRSEEPEGSRRRPLVRRVKVSKAIIGVDDPSFSDIPPSEPFSSIAPAIADRAPPSSTATPTLADLVPPTPVAGRSSRLKRRIRTDAPSNPILASLQKDLVEADLPQPPLKKFKALFDETDPDRVASQSPSMGGLMFSGDIIEESQPFSQLRTETAAGVTRATSLNGVPEEEEESESMAGPAPPRPAGADIEMTDIPATQTPGTNAKPVSKSKPASTAHTRPMPFNSSQAQQNGTTSKEIQGKSSRGAAPGKPDTDDAFLKALASTKRGKKHEDDFDREFNNLRISKPDLDREQQLEEWAVLADFGDDTNVRGNFMVVVEMDVPEHRANSRAQSREPERADWRGKPDFKAFKKKNSHRSQPMVELVVDTENDYGVGAEYWKDGSQSQSQPELVSQSEPTIGYLQPSQTQNRGFLQPPSQTLVSKSQSSSSRGTKSQSDARSTRAMSKEPARRGRSRGRALKVESDGSDVEGLGQGVDKGKQRSQVNGKEEDQPLFLDDPDGDEDGDATAVHNLAPEELEEIDVDVGADEVEEEDKVPRKRAASSRVQSAAATPSRGKKRVAAILDDDSDSGMTFRGFAGRKKTRAR